MNNDYRTIRVFRESDRWDGVDRWWSLPLFMLHPLYLETWYVDGEEVLPEHDRYVRSQYAEPVVLVY